jgi:hypothetical protein
MRTIWKYQLHCGIGEEQRLAIPGWGGVAFVADQDGFANLVTIWCHVDTDKPKWLARFMVTGTGQPSPNSDFNYVGSAICGKYVWHVWRNAVTEKLHEPL